MIKVKIKNSNIEIKGHAYSDIYGKDIVCASVSSIVITSINAILKFDKKSIKYKSNEGFISINILKENKETEIIIENMIEMLKELEKEYKRNIKIYEEV